ncbi:hypothetical protein [Lysobacter sp. Root667]|uniref:hypothetical protein n=1 Tax=Lysobacter sp. Root667 TaxID=1736581 RepID=UPI0012DCEE18|nr:hypothetical protein [Lysobacter sp. Root667]
MKPAFLVEGVTEQKFIQLVCGGHPVKIINCNGSSVVVGAIAKRAASLIRLWGGKFFPIIIVVDREDRCESANDFAHGLAQAIREEGVCDSVVIGVADRMIENWMVADPLLWPDHTTPQSVDGLNGLSILRQRLPAYNKSVDGAALLKRSRSREIASRSASFKRLKDQLEIMRCNWLRG